MTKSKRRLCATLLATALALPGTVAVAEDINVPSVVLLKETTIAAPVVFDTLDIRGKAFDWDNALHGNAPSRFEPKLSGSERSIGYGSALESDKSGKAVLRRMRFTVDASRYVNAHIRVSGITKYKIHVNGVESPTFNAFTPQRHEVIISALTLAGGNDTARISIAGDTLDGITINATSARPYTMNDMLGGLRCYDMRISPSGKLLIAVYYDTDERGKAAYYTTITETHTGRLLYRANEYADLRWIPGRDVCYFVKDINGDRRLISLDPSTGVQTVMASSLIEGHVTMSPKADYLIISAQETPDAAYTNGVKNISQPDDRMPTWRNRSNLYKYDLATGTLIRLTHGYKGAHLHDISRDGSKLLVSTSSRRLTRRPFSLTSLYQIDAVTFAIDTLLTDTGYVETFQYDPADHRRILVKGSPESFNGIGAAVREGQIPSMFESQLYLFTPGEGVRPLTKNFHPAVSRTTWSEADGNVYFTANDKDMMNFFRLDMKTGKITQIPLNLTVVTGFSLAQNTLDLAFQGQWDKGARNLYTCNLKQAAKPRITRIGDIDFEKSITGVSIAECRDWNFVSSRGDSIYGRYYLPPGFDESKKYPMIVYYYAGCVPTERYFEFRYPYQVLASQGYVVYVLQPSGTTGFGQEFAAMHVNAWGKATADDIIEGTKLFTKEHPYINPSKIGCVGASYGGFMTQYLISHSDIFASAISHAGISNIASYWGGGYWGYSYSSGAAADSYPWNNPELYVKQSPLFNADKIHTPLLLLHGSSDTNVPYTESLQMFTALKLLGREVALLEVEGEDHAIQDHAKRMEWQKAIFAWFARWLKDEPQWWQNAFPEKKM